MKRSGRDTDSGGDPGGQPSGAPEARGEPVAEERRPAPSSIDRIFSALANPTRREVVERLSTRPGSVSELAEPYPMALPSFLEHLKVLEEAGLVRSKKEGRVRTYELIPDRLRSAEGWLERQRAHWEARLDRFDAYVRTLSEEEA